MHRVWLTSSHSTSYQCCQSEIHFQNVSQHYYCTPQSRNATVGCCIFMDPGCFYVSVDDWTGETGAHALFWTCIAIPNRISAHVHDLRHSYLHIFLPVFVILTSFQSYRSMILHRLFSSDDMLSSAPQIQVTFEPMWSFDHRTLCLLVHLRYRWHFASTPNFFHDDSRHLGKTYSKI